MKCVVRIECCTDDNCNLHSAFFLSKSSVIIFIHCLLAERRALSRPLDTNLYAEIRKSTIEPESSRPQNGGVSRGAVATRPGNQLKSAKAEGKRDSSDSVQDLTLIENYLYKTSAECAKPARNSYLNQGQ